MSSVAARRFFTTTARRLTTEEKANAKASNSPAIALGAGVAITFTGAMLYFRNSKKVGDEAPWDAETLAKHKAAKDAPSALNAVVVPALTLPKDVHDRLNKWGKDDGYP
ncbi:unnamed protein product [Parascedosporium putredinis]|uniref:Uncharacterized protein n=1 Tax=Parascedosporium putredinis TaxID=1442378 RepID=A0A9P1M6C6_9PEZI|nr:unnamed protein product [Parascedosporium putredinis]CAI7988240.1 unnamed protein product [Parascedosporium putredinis]